MTTKELTARQARWAEELATYDFRIEHIKGIENKVADALSRRADYRDNTNINEEAGPILTQDGEALIINKKMRSQMVTFASQDRQLRTEIREATKQCTERRELEEHDGLKIFNGMVFIPKNMEAKVIERFHDDIREGHPGISRTMEKIQREYYFPGMYRKLKHYIKRCDHCNRNKNTYQKPKGEMIKETETPTRPWSRLTADFLEMPKIKDPNSNEELDELLVIVDTFSKMTILIPTKKTATCEEIFYLFWERVFSVFGIPDSVLSDRDKIFKTQRWRELMRKIGSEQKLSTAYHQQTDGQTERKIQELRAYYRHYLEYEQKNWRELTPIAQYAVNDAVNASTGKTPNFITFGTQRIQGKEKCEEETDSTHQQTMERLHIEVQRDLAWTKEAMKYYYDNKRRPAPTLREGERVYIRRRTSGSQTFNIRTGRQAQKMDCVKIGPYKIAEVLPKDNYKIELPERIRIHPVFHISLLDPTENPETENQDEILGEYEVERILNKRVRGGKTEYLIRWKHFKAEDDTWEPTAHLHCPEKVHDYNEKRRT